MKQTSRLATPSLIIAATLLTGLAVSSCEGAKTRRAASAPSMTVIASPTNVSRGDSVILTWWSTGASTCLASGAWTGNRSPSGSATSGPLTGASEHFTLSCTGAGGSAHSSANVTVGAQTISGLDFPGSEATTGTIRFRFTRPLAIYPATYIWRLYPRSQPTYYTAFFWGNDGEFRWDTDGVLWWARPAPNTYYGAHPYPFPAPHFVPPEQIGPRYWEISVDGIDTLSGTEVEYHRWHTQALRVWADAAGKHHEFYWDLPDTTRLIRYVAKPSYANRSPPSPALTWGDAPWNPSNEIMDGVIRGIQIYSVSLRLEDILIESTSPLSTSAGTGSVWYLNLDPTPTDISDKSGAGHDPEWVGSERPSLWTGVAP